MAIFVPRSNDATEPGVPEAGPERRVRLTLDLPAELHLRLKLVAAHEHRAMRDIVEALLDRELPSLERLSAPRPLDVSRLPTVSADTVWRFAEARARVMHGRTFTTDSAALLREARDEAEARLGDVGEANTSVAKDADATERSGC